MLLEPQAITASLVVDEHGSSVSPAGNSRGLGNQTDFELLLWLRRRAQVILTSGVTAQAEDYQMPAGAELAILTNSNRHYRRLISHIERIHFLNNHSFFEAVEALIAKGFNRIHTEFGETGFTALANQEVDCFLSSITSEGIEMFTAVRELRVKGVPEVAGLSIARVVGRGRV
jgi:riboflavin biosynthesis pyrimidine reductase